MSHNEINADKVAKKKSEDDRIAFLRQYVLNAAHAGFLNTPDVVTNAQAAWSAIEATRVP